MSQLYTEISGVFSNTVSMVVTTIFRSSSYESDNSNDENHSVSTQCESDCNTCDHHNSHPYGCECADCNGSTTCHIDILPPYDISLELLEYEKGCDCDYCDPKYVAKNEEYDTEAMMMEIRPKRNFIMPKCENCNKDCVYKCYGCTYTGNEKFCMCVSENPGFENGYPCYIGCVDCDDY